MYQPGRLAPLRTLAVSSYWSDLFSASESDKMSVSLRNISVRYFKPW